MLLTYFLHSFLLIMDSNTKHVKGGIYDVKFDDARINRYFNDAITFVVNFFIKKIKYVPKERKDNDNLVNDNLLEQQLNNNKSDDDDGFSIEIYNKYKLEQQKRKSNNGYKTQQLLCKELVSRINKQFKNYEE